MLLSSASHKATLLQRHASKMNGMTTMNTFIIKLREGYALSMCFSFITLSVLWMRSGGFLQIRSQLCIILPWCLLDASVCTKNIKFCTVPGHNPTAHTQSYRKVLLPVPCILGTALNHNSI